MWQGVFRTMKTSRTLGRLPAGLQSALTASNRAVASTLSMERILPSDLEAKRATEALSIWMLQAVRAIAYVVTAGRMPQQATVQMWRVRQQQQKWQPRLLQMKARVRNRLRCCTDQKRGRRGGTLMGNGPLGFGSSSSLASPPLIGVRSALSGPSRCERLLRLLPPKMSRAIATRLRTERRYRNGARRT